MDKCVVDGCSSIDQPPKTKNVKRMKFREFPQDSKTNQIWKEQIIDATGQEFVANGRICELHFEKGKSDGSEIPTKFFMDEEWTTVKTEEQKKVKIVLEYEDGETDKFCRVCLERSGSYLVSIYSNEITEMSPKEMIEYVAGIEINESDQLPDTICQFCCQSLEEASKIKKRCLESDQRLKELIDAIIKAEEESVKSEMDALELLDLEQSEQASSDPEVIEITLSPAKKRKKVYKTMKPPALVPKSELDLVNFRCKFCNKKLNSGYMLQIHSSKCQQKYYLCEICPQTIEFRSEYDKHIQHHIKNEDPPLELCESCDNKAFYTREEIDNHPCFQLMDPSQETFCYLCFDDSFESHRNMLNHVIKEHRTDGKFVCSFPDCQIAAFKTPNSLWWHVRSHSYPAASYICPCCGEIFGDKFNRDFHMNYHRSKTVFECDLCGNKFLSNKNKLLNHMQTNHLSDAILFQCEECFLTFHQKHKLGEHKLKVHGKIGEGAVPCEVCGVWLQSKSSIPSHMRTHQKNHKNECEICQKDDFVNAQQLKYHIELAHNRKTDFQCPICLKYFYKSWHVTKHVKFTHDPHKKYECEFCGHKSRKRAEYEAHVRNHTGERPYSCYFKGCGKTYKDIKTARMHLRTVHKAEPDSQKLKDNATASAINSDLPLV